MSYVNVNVILLRIMAIEMPMRMDGFTSDIFPKIKHKEIRELSYLGNSIKMNVFFRHLRSNVFNIMEVIDG